MGFIHGLKALRYITGRNPKSRPIGKIGRETTSLRYNCRSIVIDNPAAIKQVFFRFQQGLGGYTMNIWIQKKI